jgi:signal transduction histidine kinase
MSRVYASARVALAVSLLALLLLSAGATSGGYLIAGMGARLTNTAEQEARSETEQRLLVSSIAHDLRTPLFSLRGYLDARNRHRRPR